MYPFDRLDRVEKTFIAAGILATAVLVIAIVYGAFFL